MEESKGRIKRVNKRNRLRSPKHHETGTRMMKKRKEIKKIQAKNVWAYLKKSSKKCEKRYMDD